MSTGCMVRGHGGRYLRVCTVSWVHGRVVPAGRTWEADPFYATVFASRALAMGYADARGKGSEWSVVPDPLGREVETLGRRDCFRG